MFDIDETTLSNWTYEDQYDFGYNSKSWNEWVEKAEAPALRPTLELYRFARDNGVAVFFITGRPANLQKATEQNLKDAGYEWTGVILQPAGAQFASAVDFKAPERRKLIEQGYTIVLSMGDQQSDLTGGYAERTFKLPNPVYFLP